MGSDHDVLRLDLALGLDAADVAVADTQREAAPDTDGRRGPVPGRWLTRWGVDC